MPQFGVLRFFCKQKRPQSTPNKVNRNRTIFWNMFKRLLALRRRITPVLPTILFCFGHSHCTPPVCERCRSRSPYPWIFRGQTTPSAIVFLPKTITRLRPFWRPHYSRNDSQIASVQMDTFCDLRLFSADFVLFFCTLYKSWPQTLVILVINFAIFL